MWTNSKMKSRQQNYAAIEIKSKREGNNETEKWTKKREKEIWMVNEMITQKPNKSQQKRLNLSAHIIWFVTT